MHHVVHPESELSYQLFHLDAISCLNAPSHSESFTVNIEPELDVSVLGSTSHHFTDSLLTVS